MRLWGRATISVTSTVPGTPSTYRSASATHRPASAKASPREPFVVEYRSPTGSLFVDVAFASQRLVNLDLIAHSFAEFLLFGAFNLHQMIVGGRRSTDEFVELQLQRGLLAILCVL